MASLGRGRQAQAAAIWPGFLDLMMALVMVLMFVITIFMIIQFALRETINNQGEELDDLTSQLSSLADSLGLERARAADLESQLGALTATLADVRQDLAATETKLRGSEAARAAADAEGARLAAGLATAEGEIAALTLSLDAERARAEETLTLLAAAEAAKKKLDADLETQLSDADRQKGLLAAAEAALRDEKSLTAEGARKVTLLNEQVAALRSQLASLQQMLDASVAKDAAARVQIEALGTQLNSALARVAAEERKRAELEAAEAAHLAEEARAAKDEVRELAKYRSEFFGRLSELLAGREGVRVVGDRFVFSSEVLFEPASADLAAEGRAQIAGVVATLQEVATAIPPQIDWIIRVDGHTDATLLSGGGRYADNWELSQARALSVVRYMQNELGFPPDRLAATGFGEYRPVAPGDSAEARAANRRIELKLTER